MKGYLEVLCTMISHFARFSEDYFLHLAWRWRVENMIYMTGHLVVCRSLRLSHYHVRTHSMWLRNAMGDDEICLLSDKPSCKSSTCSSDSLLDK